MSDIVERLRHPDPKVEEWLPAMLEAAAEIERLRAPLSPTEMRLVDKHCDWVAFGHAWNAVMKARKALEGK